MANPLTMLAAPAEAYQNIIERPLWRSTLAFTTLILFVLFWLNGCWGNLSEGLQWSYLLGPALISPLIVAIVSLSSTAVLFCLLVLMGGTSSRPRAFRTLFSVNIHCAIILLLGEIVNILLIHAGPVTRMHLPLANRFPVGLDVLLLGTGSPNIYTAAFLHSTSIFILWYMAALSGGVREVFGVSRRRSRVLVAAYWLILVTCTLGIVFALGGGTAIRLQLS